MANYIWTEECLNLLSSAILRLECFNNNMFICKETRTNPEEIPNDN